MLSKLTLIPFFVTLIFLSTIDFLWLSITSQIYKKYLAHLFGANVNWIGVLLFYPLYAIGLYIFVIKQFGENSTLLELFLYGALFGFVAYGTYDLTNYATLREWPGFIVALDMFWGALLSGLVSVATVCILKWISQI